MPSFAVDPLDHKLHETRRRNWPACTKPCDRKILEGTPCSCTGGLHVLSACSDPEEAIRGVCSEDCIRYGGTSECRCYGTDRETTEGGW